MRRKIRIVVLIWEELMKRFRRKRKSIWDLWLFFIICKRKMFIIWKNGKFYYLCCMKNLITYYCRFLYDIFWAQILIVYSIKSFNDQSIFMFILFITFFFWGIEDLITRHSNFMKYYPYFDHKWDRLSF